MITFFFSILNFNIQFGNFGFMLINCLNVVLLLILLKFINKSFELKVLLFLLDKKRNLVNKSKKKKWGKM